MKTQCKSCLGVYSNVQDDGTSYYHACPPITQPDGKEVERPNARNENIGKEKIGLGVDSISIIKE